MLTNFFEFPETFFVVTIKFQDGSMRVSSKVVQDLAHDLQREQMKSQWADPLVNHCKRFGGGVYLGRMRVIMVSRAMMPIASPFMAPWVGLMADQLAKHPFMPNTPGFFGPGLKISDIPDDN